MQNVVEQVDAAFLYVIGFSLALLLLITGVMIYFLFRYRTEKNPEAADIRGNLWLEFAWTLIPTLIALSMFYVGWQSFLGLRGVPKDALDVRVTAMQFAWSFKYPNGKVSDTLVVPLGRPVKLTLTSLDMIHGFYVPSFRIKMDALPKMKTYTWFFAGKPGVYNVMCTQYCGAGHAEMRAELRVVPVNEFAAWAGKEKGKP